jgi:hypothetical protein
MHVTANLDSRWFESSPLLQIEEMWQSPVYCNSLENCRVEMHREFESHRFRQSCLRSSYNGTTLNSTRNPDDVERCHEESGLPQVQALNVNTQKPKRG